RLEDLRVGLALRSRTQGLVPPGWDGLHKKAPCAPKKGRMTIRLDQDVLDWYRDLGTGYQVRINLVLRAYMEAIIAKHIESPGDRDWLMNPL
ncbi:MAG: BrnA antitoxin family protein, partial [Pseudomonadota bacterium]